MGLPMFREPGGIQTKAATKVKPTDSPAVARSAIRRQHTLRYNSHAHNPSLARQRSRARNAAVDRRSLFDIIRRDRDNAAGTTTSASRSGGGNIDQDVEADADLARAEASNRRRLENGRAILRDALSYERPGHRMRQTRESNLRQETAPPSPPRSWNRGAPPSRAARRSPTPDYMATLYITRDVHPHRNPRSRQTAPFPGTASLTPGFAPAYRFEGTASPPDAEDQSGPRDGTGPNFADYPEPTPSSYPSRRSRRQNPSQDHTDGLGDRRRSFSPDENQWETLLTTITPDEYLPSTASTSFTSAAASAMISDPSQSSTSSTTLLTAPSSTAPSSTDTLNMYPPICDEQDLSSDSDFSEYREYEEDLLDEARQAATSANEPPPPDPSRYSANVLEASRRASQQISEQFNRARRRSDRELELAQMHAILDRMERREEVPDEWWAAAGLSRNLGGRVERVDRERL